MSFFFQTVAGLLRGSILNNDAAARNSYNNTCSNRNSYALEEIVERRTSSCATRSNSVVSQKSSNNDTKLDE